ncbi:hypothetical protein AGR5A_pb0011 [Agrobacterium genomosp. 5 str. CFBP 6626]|nr:hypothetical protein AGR5A_pb0011 [Agrobacterium genomosp. 5 str. CFBP 6626]
MSEDFIDRRRCRVLASPVDIEPCRCRDLPRLLQIRLSVISPDRLLIQYGLENRLEAVLLAGGFEYPYGIVGSLMEGRVAQDETDIGSRLRHHLLDDRIEGPAGLAGRIEELDDGDGSGHRSHDRRMHPDQGVVTRHGDWCRCRLGGAAAI